MIAFRLGTVAMDVVNYNVCVASALESNNNFSIKCPFGFQAAMFRLPWKLWRYLEGGKIAEFGMEAKRHLVSSEAEEGIAHQYATAFYSALHRNNSYYAQVWSLTHSFYATWRWFKSF